MALSGDAVSFRGASNAGAEEVARFTGAGEDLLHHATLGNPSMNAWFFRAAVFAQIGVFDASYRVAGDREFMLRLACSGLRCGQISRLVYRYRIHPGSMTFGGNEEIWQTIVSEHNRMTADYLRKPALSKRARSLLTRTRTRETLQMAIRSARNRRWRLLVFYARAGIRYAASMVRISVMAGQCARIVSLLWHRKRAVSSVDFVRSELPSAAFPGFGFASRGSARASTRRACVDNRPSFYCARSRWSAIFPRCRRMSSNPDESDIDRPTSISARTASRCKANRSNEFAVARHPV